MIEVAITSRMKEWAKKKANSHVKGKRFDENINRRDSVYIGYLGESVFWEENKKARHIDNSGYDFLLNNKKIEVKAYWSQFKPRPSFYLKIPTQDIKRTAEGAVYSFICIDTSSDRAWYLGQYPVLMAYSDLMHIYI